MNEEYIVKIVENPHSLWKDVYLVRYTPEGAYVLNGETETFVKHSETRQEVTPTLKLSPDMLQALADGLRNVNIKPKEEGKTAGLLEAQTEHLKDLRKLLKLHDK